METEKKSDPVELKVVAIRDPKTIDFNIEISKSNLGQERVDEIVKQADGFVVETDEEAHKGLSLALTARKQGKEISKLRKQITEPALRFQKEAIKIEKQFLEELSTVEADLLEKIEVYKQQRKATLEANDIVDDSFDKLEVELGSSSVKSYYEHKIVDENAIPRQYLKIDNAAVKEAIKDGVREIPGLEIYEVKKMQYRLKGGRKT